MLQLDQQPNMQDPRRLLGVLNLIVPHGHIPRLVTPCNPPPAVIQASCSVQRIPPVAGDPIFIIFLHARHLPAQSKQLIRQDGQVHNTVSMTLDVEVLREYSVQRGPLAMMRIRELCFLILNTARQSVSDRDVLSFLPSASRDTPHKQPRPLTPAPGACTKHDICSLAWATAVCMLYPFTR
ncbi:hypothetical protein BDW62DRAFT_196816 [Aspergillus aurantiobrunneus]